MIFQHHLTNIEEVKQAMKGSFKDDTEFRMLSSHNPKDFNVNLLLLYVKGTSMSEKKTINYYHVLYKYVTRDSKISKKGQNRSVELLTYKHLDNIYYGNPGGLKYALSH